jgi:hypothetical protein
MSHLWRRSLKGIFMFLVLATMAACATIKVNTIPPPPPTAKLRVYVESFTLGSPHRAWKVPHEKFVENQVRGTERVLKRTDIYEVVNSQEVRAVIGDQVLSYDSMKNFDWAQARRIGSALYADFILVVTRDKSNVGTGEWVYIIATELVNVATGKAFRSTFTLNNVTGADGEAIVQLIKTSYRDIFSQAKHDMFSVAVRKGRAYAPVAPSQAPSATAAKPVEKPTPKREQPMLAKTVPPAPNLPGSGLIEASKKVTDAKKLVVYDLESTDQYRTMALILAEALREEVYKLKEFVLVNREDLQKVLEEMALQQTGLIDEKQAVKTGKGLAANQVVTGRLGQLGKIFVMQAKRVDVETFATLGISSVKFTEGQEDEALNKLPDFARSLVGLQ